MPKYELRAGQLDQLLFVPARQVTKLWHFRDPLLFPDDLNREHATKGRKLGLDLRVITIRHDHEQTAQIGHESLERARQDGKPLQVSGQEREHRVDLFHARAFL